MSGQSGASAYVRLQVPQDGMNQALQYWGARKAKENDDAKLAEERAQVRKQQQIKEWEDKYGLKEGDFANKYTGFKSFDDMNTDFAMDTTSQYVDLQRKARDAWRRGDLREKNRIEGEMIKLKGAFKEAAKSQDFFAKQFESYKDAVAKGIVSGASKKYEQIVQKALLENNAALRYRDGQLVYTTVVDGEPQIIPYQDIMDGSFSWFQKQQISGKDGLVDSILNDLGSVTRKDANGYYNITTKAWDDGAEGGSGIHSQATDKAIDALLGSDEVMGDLLYQFSGADGGEKVAKMKNFDDADYELVKNSLKDLVRAGYDEKFETTFNNSKYATDSANARARAKKKEDTEELSRLHFDVLRAVEQGDYTVLLNNLEGAFDNQTVSKIVESADGQSLTLLDSSGNEITSVNKTRRAITDLIINSSDAYKNMKTEDVLAADPVAYRDNTTGAVSILNLADRFFDDNGSPTVDDEVILSTLQNAGITNSKDNVTWSGNSLKVNDVDVDTSSKEAFQETLGRALGQKKKVEW